MKLYIFECSQNTFQTCVSGGVFGAGEKATWVMDVCEGDICLLYNVTSHIIHGVWKATSKGGAIRDANLWNGRYPNQVSVALASEHIQGVPRDVVKNIVTDTARNRVSNTLSDKSAADLLKHFEPEPTESTGTSTVAGLQPEIIDFRKRHPAEYRCKDGHYVRSPSETRIDDWLSENRIFHAYEPVARVPKADEFIPDLLVYDQNNAPVYIEYWGIENDERYLENKRRKLRIYDEYGLHHIDLGKNEVMDNLDLCLYQKLKQFGVLP